VRVKQALSIYRMWIVTVFAHKAFVACPSLYQGAIHTPKLNLSFGDMQLRADPGLQERVKGIDQQIEGVMRDTNKLVLVTDFTK